jgi:hypothetical protein
MNALGENNGTDSKSESSVYPYTSLAPSLKIADAIKELGGARSPVSKSSLAAHLKEGEKSASLLQRISSAKAFGLITGRSEYSLSESAKRYYFPTSEHDKSNAQLNFLSAPLGFRELIRRYDGDKLPSREILANILQREFGVPDSWKDRAAAFFENSAQLIGVIDGDRFLRVKATEHSATRQTTVAISLGDAIKQSRATAQAALPSSSTPEMFSDHEEQSFFLDKDKTRKFTINSPLFISRAEYERICKWIEVTLIVEDKKEGQSSKFAPNVA